MKRIAVLAALGLLVAGCTKVERVTTELTTSPRVPASAPGASPTEVASPAIDIETPLANTEAGSPVSITGTADVVDASLTVQILDANGIQLAATVVEASCGDGCRGTFATELFFFVERRQPGTIEVSGVSDAGRALASVPVVIVPA